MRGAQLFRSGLHGVTAGARGPSLSSSAATGAGAGGTRGRTPGGGASGRGARCDRARACVAAYSSASAGARVVISTTTQERCQTGDDEEGSLVHQAPLQREHYSILHFSRRLCPAATRPTLVFPERRWNEWAPAFVHEVVLRLLTGNRATSARDESSELPGKFSTADAADAFRRYDRDDVHDSDGPPPGSMTDRILDHADSLYNLARYLT